MARLTGHGGGCCGVAHISGMSNANGFNEVFLPGIRATVEQWTTHLDRLLRGYLTARNRNRVVEITLTDDQCRSMPNLLAALGSFGFVPVTRFRNSNSGNNVTIFHRIERSAGPFPFTMGEPAVREEFVRVYASGRRSKWFASRAQAEAYTGKATVARIEARTVNNSRLFG